MLTLFNTSPLKNRKGAHFMKNKSRSHDQQPAILPTSCPWLQGRVLPEHPHIPSTWLAVTGVILEISCGSILDATGPPVLSVRLATCACKGSHYSQVLKDHQPPQKSPAPSLTGAQPFCLYSQLLISPSKIELWHQTQSLSSHWPVSSKDLETETGSD